MFKSEFRLKEKQKDGKTVYILQEKTLWFFWWNLSDPIEDKLLADALYIIFKYQYS